MQLVCSSGALSKLICKEKPTKHYALSSAKVGRPLVALELAGPIQAAFKEVLPNSGSKSTATVLNLDLLSTLPFKNKEGQVNLGRC